MKTSTILILVLFAFATKTSLFALANTPVLDVDGDSVAPGVEYYMVSLIWGVGLVNPGLGLRCPEVVIQQRIDRLKLPVIFSTINGSNDVVYENTKLTVTVVLGGRRCLTSTTWQVFKDESTGKQSVSLGGVEGEFATEFTLKEHTEFYYKFQHNGNDIGRYFDSDGFIRLAVDNEYPWTWTLIKANRSKTIKQVVNV